MTENENIQKVINIALAEVGYLEKRNGDISYLYDKVGNSGYGNLTKYGYEMHQLYPKTMDYPAAWCCAFCNWCFYKAFGFSTAQKMIRGNFDDYTVNSAQMYKNKGAYYKSNPKVGDQIFFRNNIRICHTGLVYAVDSKYVYTVEGNTSNASGVIANGGAVSKKKYLLTYNRIDGYGRPAYNLINDFGANLVSTSKPTIPSATPNLAYGSKGNAIKNLQKCLNYIMKSSLVTDGSFGPKTETLLKQFQTKYNLEVDGVYGKTSRKKFQELIK